MTKPSSYLTSGNLALLLAAATSAHVFLNDDKPGTPPRDPHNVADVVDNVLPGTVYIGVKGAKPSEKSKDEDSMPSGSLGSGFVIDGQNGYIVTNNHVIESAAEDSGSQVEITLTNGKTLSAKIIGRDTVADVAVLKVESDTPLPAVKFGNSAALRVGAPVVAIGNPFGLSSTTTTGIISATNRDSGGPYDDMLQTDAAINKGNSGGALFNMDGEVIGVNTAIFSPSGGSVGIGFSIPSNRVTKIASTIIASGDIKHGWLGVSMKAATEEEAKKAGLSSTRGILVIDTADKGPAQTAGLKAGDILLAVNGETLTTPKKLSRIVIDSLPDSNVQVTYWRDGAEHTMTVKLGDYKTLQKMQEEAAKKEAEKEKEKQKEGQKDKPDEKPKDKPEDKEKPALPEAPEPEVPAPN